MNSDVSTKKEKSFRSGISGKFLRLSSFFLLVGISFLAYGILLRHFLLFLSYIPMAIGVIVLLGIGASALSCLGKVIYITPDNVSFKQGKFSVTIPWESATEFRERKKKVGFVELYRSFFVGDGQRSFEVENLSFPDYVYLLEIVKIARESKAREYRI